ncbi:MAG TPA: HEAT repeat domain-containing protein [Gemmataceae bacterium]|nr:HEAT repeat domain-containing protein [Gemmataceae bacterium]
MREQREQFLAGLLVNRADLAGLPFRKGKGCRLDRGTAEDLDRTSQEVRARLVRFPGGARRGPVQDREYPEYPASMALQVYEGLARDGHLRDPAALPALEQILTGELVPVRLALVQYLQAPSDTAGVAAALARRAVFDPSAEVRQEAVRGLRDRPAAAYLPILLCGLRHPWPPANYNAAAALTALGAEGAVPDLLRVLDAPDPRSPFEVTEGGKRVWAVRELVRVNHHGSCLLCHAPSFTRDDLVRAPVPSPFEPLPSPVRYYAERGATAGGLFVRADVTYLRQDFSEILPVENAKPWPRLQRFDFLVRVRPLTRGEVQAWHRREQLAGPSTPPASHQAAVFALRGLTGLDGGYTADSWRKALAHAGPRGPVSPASADVRGR